MADPHLDRLLASLVQSKIQTDNNPLFQTVKGLIDFNRQIQQELTAALTALKNQVDGGNTPNKIGGLLGASYITKDDDHVTLTNARKAIAGPGITIDYGTAHQAKFSSFPSGTPVFFPEDSSSDGILIPGPAGATGPQGPAGTGGSGGGVTPWGMVDEYPGDDYRIPGPTGPAGPTGSLNYFAAQPTANTNGTANVAVNVTGASITLPAGTYLIWGQVSIQISGADTYVYCDIYDGSAVRAQAQADLKVGISTVGYCGTAPIVMTFTTSSTTLNLRFATGLGGASSVALATFSGNPTTGIFACRLDGSPAYGNLIGLQAYAAGTDTTLISTGSTSFVDMDATNAIVTFVAPASGKVLVRLSALTSTDFDGASGYFGIREGSTTLGSCLVVQDSLANRANAEFYISGLTPGSSHTYKAAVKTSAHNTLVLTGPGYGQLVIEVWDANTSTILNNNFLGYISYNPGTTQDKTTTSSSFADVDSSNLLLTFTAPASGKVLVILTGDGYQSAGNYYSWNLRSGGSDVSGTAQVIDAAPSIESRRTAKFFITGLTPGTSYTYTWGFAVTAGTAHLRYGSGSPNIGPAQMEAWALPA